MVSFIIIPYDYVDINYVFSYEEPHRLLILNAQPSDSGRYRCLARNEYSEAFAEEDITVEGKLINFLLCCDNY